MSSSSDIFEKIVRKNKMRRVTRRILRFFLRFLGLLALLFIALWFLFQNTRFQNWITQQAATYLSEELKTRVEVDFLDLDFFDKLALNKVYVEDLEGDTLLFAEKIKVNFNTNLIQILQRSLEIESVSLINTQFNLVRDSAQNFNNLVLLIENMNKAENSNSDASSKKKKKPFLLDLGSIYLNSVRFVKEDREWGKYANIFVDKGEITLNEFNLYKKLIDIETAVILKPIVIVEERIRNEEELEDDSEEENTNISNNENTKLDSLQTFFKLKIDHFDLNDGKMISHNFRKSPIKITPREILDYNHLDVFNINIDIDSFSFTQDVYKGEIKKISLEDVSGFVLNELSAKEATIQNRRVDMNGMKLITPYSNVGDTLVFKYRTFYDFLEFNDKVRMDLKLNQAQIAVKDLMIFAPPLETNPFFIKNQEEVFLLDGDLKGRVNNLRGKKLNIQLGKGTTLKGDFSSRNLSIKNEEFLNLRLERLTTDMQTIKDLVPNFDPPTNWYNLGHINFSGRFDGFFADYVADGELITDLGKATMDMRLDTKNGKEKAEYSGKLKLLDFDLAKFTGNKDFGKITLSTQVEDGFGLTLNTLDAKLGAKIESFNFKNYDYQNLKMEGELNKNLFDGDFSIKDENIDFIFSGSIEMKDSIPFFDFAAKVNRLDLQALNLIQQNFVLAADSIDLKINGNNISNVQGTASAQDIEIIKNDTSTYKIESLLAFSRSDSIRGKKMFHLKSELLEGRMDGYFNMQQAPQAVLTYLEKNYTDFAKNLGIKTKEIQLLDHQFDFEVEIFDSKDLLELIDPELDTLKNVKLSGYFNNVQDSLFVEVEVPYLGYKNIVFDDIYFMLKGNQNQSDTEIGVNHTVLNDKTHFQPLWAMGYINQDTLNFGINATNFNSLFDNLNLNGQLFFLNDFLQISFEPSDLVILGEQWDIDKNNYIRFRKDHIETKNFELSNQEKIITLQSQGKKGLLFQLENLDIEFVNELWTYDKLKFTGPIVIKAETTDAFQLKDLTANVSIDSFLVNKDNWGLLNIDAKMQNLKEPVIANLSIGKGERVLIAQGFFVPPTETSRKRGTDYPPNFFEYKIDILNYPLNIAEYFIGHAISNTTGTFNADVELNGVPSKPNISGTMTVPKGALTLDYLGSRYFIDNQTANINNTIFDASGVVITDRFANKAFVTGGITHNHLKNWGLNANVYSPKFEALNTTKEDNPTYYGTGIGKGNVSFTGSFKQTNITVEATTGRGTDLNIPIVSQQGTTNRSFISFINNNQNTEEDEGPRINRFKGINLDMNLKVTDESEIKLIFDEKEGDVISGKGNGNIQLSITRDGDMSMYGDYVIEEGDYLFTLSEFGVNKKFNVKQGGTIRWTGDPFDARIDLEASYSGLRAAPFEFIKEVIGLAGSNAALETEAKKKKPVDLTMILDGALMQPNINFRISFPTLSGELKGLVENRMKIVSQDQNDINRQVFGLIVFGSFLPSGNDAFSNSSPYAFVVNTLTEMLSNQLSLLLSEMISTSLKEGSVISGFDFNFSADVQNNTTADLNNLASWEFQVRPKIYLWDDRVSIETGLVSGEYIGQTYTVADIAFDLRLTEDGRWKFFFYNRPELDVQGRTNKTGTGIRYRKEFDSFKELFSKKARKKRKAEKKARKKAEKAIENEKADIENLTTKKN